MVEQWAAGATAIAAGVVGALVVGGIVGGVVGCLAALMYALVRPVPACPNCAARLPMIRRPANQRQALFGGWTCPRCGCEVDRDGKKVEAE